VESTSGLSIRLSFAIAAPCVCYLRSVAVDSMHIEAVDFRIRNEFLDSDNRSIYAYHTLLYIRLHSCGEMEPGWLAKYYMSSPMKPSIVCAGISPRRV
jgi:hypothetical protein